MRYCNGKWVAGSGGHRTHESCGKPATWKHPEDCYAYCDEHIKEHEKDQYVNVKPVETVGDLVDELQKYDRDLPIRICYETYACRCVDMVVKGEWVVTIVAENI